MKVNKFLILLFFVNLSFAQQITTAKIKNVGKSGLHRIILPSEIRSFSKENLSDFRIFDAKGIEVPYFTFQENDQMVYHFEEYAIVSKTVIPKKNTSIIFENPNKTIHEISLYISNSDVVKTYNISGSNDQNEWFGLSNKQVLSNLNSAESTITTKTISFPLCSYRYLKIDFDDKKTLAINVLKIGNLSNQIEKSILQEISPKNIQTNQIPSEKKTRIHLVFDNPQIIDQILFTISSPSYYNRAARIYVNKTLKIKKRKETYQKEIASFDLNSKSDNIFNLHLYEKDFFIEIDNKDNQALTFSEIKCNQIPVSIIADLRTNENYSVKTGNSKLNAPQYDLSYFKNKINDSLPEAKIIDIKHQNLKNEIAQTKSFWQQSWFMWLCITIGGISVLYFTTTLVRDIKNNS